MTDEDSSFSKSYLKLLEELKLCLQQEFQSKLNDAGLFTKIHSKKTLNLEDIYVPPELIILNDEKNITEKINIENLIDNVCSKFRGIIYGESQSGKTSLCYYIFSELFNKGEVPIYLSGKTVRTLSKNQKEKVIKNILKEQYCGINIIANLSLKNCILIFDDFQLYKDRSHLEFLSEFKSVILVADSILQHDYTVDINDFIRYSISEYSARLREKLLCKWINIGIDETVDIKRQMFEMDCKQELINKTLGKALSSCFMPSYPFFILSILIGTENNGNLNTTDITSQGNCYSFLVYINLKRCEIKGEDIHSYENILSSLSFYMYEKRNKYIGSSEINDFFQNYDNKYLLPFSFSSEEVNYKKLLDKLCSAQILSNNMRDCYEFRYPYLYYYFLSKFFTQNYQEYKNKIDDILDDLQLEENGHICMFLVYHSVHNEFIDSLLNKAKDLFKEFEPATLKKKELSFFCDNLKIEEFLYLSSNGEVKKARENSLEIQSELEEATSDYHEESTFEDNTEDGLLKDLYKSIRTVEIIGNIVRNRYGSLQIGRQKKIIQEAININLRIISYVFDAIKNQNNQQDIISWIKKRLEHLIKKKNIEGNIDYLEKATEIFWNINYFIICGFIYQTVRSIGTKNLNRIISDLSSEKSEPSYSLIEHGIKLFYNYEIDVSKIEKDFKDYSYSFVAELIMKHLISFFSQYNIIDFKEKQRISARLGIQFSPRKSADEINEK